jgi:hypothetical protein
MFCKLKKNKLPLKIELFPGTWNCSPAHEKISSHYLRGVIEVVPEPTTVSLFAIGALVLLRKRRA